MSNRIYTDEELERIFGMRQMTRFTMSHEPPELGLLCPVDHNHLTTWSRFALHIYCYRCDQDIYTGFCPVQRNLFNGSHVAIKRYQRNSRVLHLTMDEYRHMTRDRARQILEELLWIRKWRWSHKILEFGLWSACNILLREELEKAINLI